VAVSEEWAAGARNFCNKLWNATRFALLNGAVTDAAPVAGPGEPSGLAELARRSELAVPDRWILSRLAEVTAEVDALFERFEFGKACDVLYHFAWDEFCDWYLELAKASLTGADHAAAAATRLVLGTVLDRLLRLLHPVIPFVTDELWTALTGGDTVMIAPWRVATAVSGRLFRPGGRGRDRRACAAGLWVRVPLGPGPAPVQPVPADQLGIETTPLANHGPGSGRCSAHRARGGFAPATVQAEG
jgi:isoleucyl-tRNA synthetase